MSKVGRNELCPCGSGKKFKRCCLEKGDLSGYTQADRTSAFAKLDRFIDDFVPEEEEGAYEEFWGRFLDREDELPEDVEPMSSTTYDVWFAFDRPREDGRVVADELLAHGDLTRGERAFLETLKRSSMRLYEIAEVFPGVSLGLRDLLEGAEVTVQERSASRSLGRHEWIAARVVPRGASAKPEIEAGVLPIPRLYQQSVRDQLARMRDAFRRDDPDADIDSFYKETPPFFHEVWAGAFLEPAIPKPHNTDGEPMVITRVTSDVLDAPALINSLDRTESLERGEGTTWQWSGTNAHGKLVSLGTLRLTGESLVLEANSVERARRGRTLIESLAESAIRHRLTTHEDMERMLRDALSKRRPDDAREERREEGIPADVKEALVLNELARHYRAWIDESIPALHDRTPREAAKDPALRPALVDLIKGLEVIYQQSLRRGDPAYDPSWMWAELGLDDKAAPRHPPPLAHERIAQLAPGSGELCRAVAEALRRAPGFSDRSTLLTDDVFTSSLELQRFLREGDNSRLAPYLRLLIDFELHRRKSFWVDDSLAFMLAQTDLDVLGRELRMPFASFALVFSDRAVLSMAERLLASNRSSPLAGQILRGATVFVTEENTDAGRRLKLAFALDALGADLPALVRHEIPLAEEGLVQAHLDALAPPEPKLPSFSPLRGLILVSINAILYATSVGVELQTRGAPDKPGPRRAPDAHLESEQVYFLPGAIEISGVRAMRELERIPDGRTALRRFLVRGHWRRASPSWTDQRLHWIQPYWKGPDMATIIERTYRLKP
jgi:hypothetical protein